MEIRWLRFCFCDFIIIIIIIIVIILIIFTSSVYRKKTCTEAASISVWSAESHLRWREGKRDVIDVDQI